MDCAGPLQRNIIFISIQSCNTEGQVSPCVPGQEWRQSNIRNTLGAMRDYSRMSAGGHFQRLLSNKYCTFIVTPTVTYTSTLKMPCAMTI